MPSRRRRLPRSLLGRLAVRCTRSLIKGAADDRAGGQQGEGDHIGGTPAHAAAERECPRAQPAAAGAITAGVSFVAALNSETFGWHNAENIAPSRKILQSGICSLRANGTSWSASYEFTQAPPQDTPSSSREVVVNDFGPSVVMPLPKATAEAFWRQNPARDDRGSARWTCAKRKHPRAHQSPARGYAVREAFAAVCRRKTSSRSPKNETRHQPSPSGSVGLSLGIPWCDHDGAASGSFDSKIRSRLSATS